jgi:hypothetical protein
LWPFFIAWHRADAVRLKPEAQEGIPSSCRDIRTDHGPILAPGGDTKSTGTRLNDTINLPAATNFTMSGDLTQVSGSLDLAGGGDIAGSGHVEAEATLNFVGGQFVLEDGLVVDGNGTVNVGAADPPGVPAAALAQVTVLTPGTTRFDTAVPLNPLGIVGGPGNLVIIDSCATNASFGL